MSGEIDRARDEEVGWAIRRVNAFAYEHDCWVKVSVQSESFPRAFHDGNRFRVGIGRNGGYFGLSDDLAEACLSALEQARDEWAV